MREKGLSGLKQNATRTIITGFVSMFLIVLVLIFLTDSYGIHNNRIEKLDDYMYSVVTRGDLSVERYEKGQFPRVTSRDKVTVFIPGERVRGGYGKSICFYSYNSVIDVYAGANLIYTYGEELLRKDLQIGNILCRAPIPTDAEKTGVQITFRPQGLTNISDFHNVYLMPTEEASLYPLYHHEVDFMIFLAILCFSFIGIGILILMGFLSKKLNISTICLLSFTLLMSVWFLGYNDMFYILTDNMRLASNAEYYALFTGCIPFMFHLYLTTDNKIPKRIYLFLGIFHTIAFFCFLYVHLRVKGVYFTNMLFLEHIFMLCTIFLIFLNYMVFPNKNQSLSERIFITGIVLFFIFVTLEVFRMRITNSEHFDVFIFNTSFSTLGILFFIGSLFLSNTIQYTNVLNERLYQVQLELLAYKDYLTGIPNRSDCYRHFRSMSEVGGRNSYSLIFMDVNYLKLANDKYGHKTGDRLLKFVAGSISKSFPRDMQGEPDESRGFFGRWGGDEFIAVIYDPEDADHFISDFDELLKEENAAGTFPFPLAVAKGRIDVTGSSGLSPDEAIIKADALMYENKLKLKETRDESEAAIAGTASAGSAT